MSASGFSRTITCRLLGTDVVDHASCRASKLAGNESHVIQVDNSESALLSKSKSHVRLDRNGTIFHCENGRVKLTTSQGAEKCWGRKRFAGFLTERSRR